MRESPNPREQVNSSVEFNFLIHRVFISRADNLRSLNYHGLAPSLGCIKKNFSSKYSTREITARLLLSFYTLIVFFFFFFSIISVTSYYSFPSHGRRRVGFSFFKTPGRAERTAAASWPHDPLTNPTTCLYAVYVNCRLPFGHLRLLTSQAASVVTGRTPLFARANTLLDKGVLSLALGFPENLFAGARAPRRLCVPYATSHNIIKIVKYKPISRR